MSGLEEWCHPYWMQTSFATKYETEGVTESGAELKPYRVGYE
jgi:hypothetical protein